MKQEIIGWQTVSDISWTICKSPKSWSMPAPDLIAQFFTDRIVVYGTAAWDSEAELHKEGRSQTMMLPQSHSTIRESMG